MESSTWKRGADLKRALVARCDAYCAATGTPRSFLSLTLTHNPATLTRLTEGGDMGLDLYDACRTGLDRLESLAGINNGGKDWPDGDALRNALRSRCDAYCAATGVASTRLGAMVANNTALMSRLASGDGNIRLDKYDEWMTALDELAERLRGFFRSEKGDPDGRQTQERRTEDERNRDEGEVLHRPRREPRSREGGLLQGDQ